MKITGTMRALDDTRGAVRVEDVYDTDIDDLWEACTNPERLARWIAEVSGDLRVGGTVHAVFTSTWTGPATDRGLRRPAPPAADDRARHRRREPDRGLAHRRGARTRLVVEERGLPVDQLHFYGAGWQVHLEDLGRSLATRRLRSTPAAGRRRAPAPAWQERWTALTPAYENLTDR